MSAAHKPFPADRKLIAEAFAANVKGRMQQAQIDSIVKVMLSDTAEYPATGLFLPTLSLTITNGETFTATATGVPLGAGQFSGDVFTDDLDALYTSTVSFSFLTTPVSMSIQFFDSKESLLGHFLGSVVSGVVGVGGGLGNWA